PLPRQPGALLQAAPPPAPALATSGAPPTGDVGGIVAALDQRAQSAGAVFAQARQRIATSAAQHAAHARAEGAPGAMAIAAEQQTCAAQLHQAARAAGARAVEAATRAAHVIAASATAVRAQITAASQTAVSAIPDADADERAGLHEALTEAATRARHEMDASVE